MGENMDISSFTLEDLQDEYQRLKERFFQLNFIHEQDTQRIHELRRSLDTATAAEAYLVQELEQLSSMQTSQVDVQLHKKQNELDELKKRQKTLLTENEELHRDIADLHVENKTLCEKIKELTVASLPLEIPHKIPKEQVEIREKLEAENLELFAKLDETQESVITLTMSLAEKEKRIEMLNDQVLCLEENLQSKREEVDEKSHLLESAHEQIIEMNAKIALLTSSPENADRKGNSLFAEVDDQRQAMKQLLADQKKSYEEMRKIFNKSQHEIRRLKRENIAMHNELQACSTIFCSADKTYKEKLNERILQLLKQNEDLEKKLSFTQQELISMANDKGVVWLDSMLLFCKQETEELKQELHSNRIQKGILEERLRNSQQELAKWRFEALKRRCILIDREGLLTDNKIQFRNFTNNDVPLPYSEIENAKPNIEFGNHSRSQTLINKQNSTNILRELECDSLEKQREKCHLPFGETKTDELEKGNQHKSLELIPETLVRIKIEASEAINAFSDENCTWKNENQQNMQSQMDPAINKVCPPSLESYFTNDIKDDEKELIISNSAKSLGKELDNVRLKSKINDEDNKENLCVSSLESRLLPKSCANSYPKELQANSLLKLETDLKPRSSILVTKRDILSDENNTKTVHFAQTETFEQTDQHLQSKFVCKSIRTKSNVIFRRILVSSKSKNEPGNPPQ